MLDKQPIEVRPDSGQWVVARKGSSRALSKHPTQKEAEPVGRDRARRDKVEFILKGRDGHIRKKDSYGSDPPSVERVSNRRTLRRQIKCGDNDGLSPDSIGTRLGHGGRLGLARRPNRTAVGSTPLY